LPDIELKLASNHYAFHWSFPEMLADSRGFFAQNSLKIKWANVTPQVSVNKSEMYIDILDKGVADLYHAADWVCIDRTMKSRTGWMVAKSPAGEGNLNSSFTLFAGKSSGIDKPSDLSRRPIAVDMGTGSYYTAMLDLGKFIPRSEINLVEMGEPNQRLVALLEGRVDGASLLSPWSDIARALGMKELLRTTRTGSTVLVARRDLLPDVLERFFGALNTAVRLIDDDPDSCRVEYFAKIEEILLAMPIAVKKAAESLKDTIPVPQWSPWAAFTEEDFQLAYSWMVESRLAKPGVSFLDVSYPFSGDLF
jgi:ABC-type nitrate/sulfonate/bicarbonate transport system substrate-binding protein